MAEERDGTAPPEPKEDAPTDQSVGRIFFFLPRSVFRPRSSP